MSSKENQASVQLDVFGANSGARSLLGLVACGLMSLTLGWALLDKTSLIAFIFFLLTMPSIVPLAGRLFVPSVRRMRLERLRNGWHLGALSLDSEHLEGVRIVVLKRRMYLIVTPTGDNSWIAVIPRGKEGVVREVVSTLGRSRLCRFATSCKRSPWLGHLVRGIALFVGLLYIICSHTMRQSYDMLLFVPVVPLAIVVAWLSLALRQTNLVMLVIDDLTMCVRQGAGSGNWVNAESKVDFARDPVRVEALEFDDVGLKFRNGEKLFDLRLDFRDGDERCELMLSPWSGAYVGLKNQMQIIKRVVDESNRHSVGGSVYRRSVKRSV